MATTITPLRSVDPYQVRAALRIVGSPRPEDSERLRAQCWHVLKLAKAGHLVQPLQRTDAPDGEA